ncbi:hypothetical protein NEAUS06_0888 [Nematocida ausubeli]|nr:hypothetical protein NEAUS06_0888 [Nematocida ausubeli]
MDSSRNSSLSLYKGLPVVHSYKRHLLDKADGPERTAGITKVILDGMGPNVKPRGVYSISCKFDICEIFVQTSDDLLRCAQWQIHSVQLDMTGERAYTKGSISSAVHAGIYFTIDMDGYINPATKRMWIYNVRNLLRLCSKKNILVVYSADRMNEEEILQIFQKFKIKRRVAVGFYTINMERMLVTAAMKKYAYKGSFVPIEENETDFKRMVYRATKPLKSIKG